jgi:hypothetical protein
MEYLWIALGLVLVAAVVAGLSTGARGPKSASKLALPDIGQTAWSLSEKGNDTALLRGSRVTVFPDYTVWKFCISDEGEDSEPFFSESYATKEAARFEAIAMVEGRPSQYPTTREIRAQRLIAGLGSGLEREAEQLVAIEKSVARAISGKGGSTANLSKRVRSRRNIARRLWVDCHGDENQKQIDEAARIMNRYDELLDAVEGLSTPAPS